MKAFDDKQCVLKAGLERAFRTSIRESGRMDYSGFKTALRKVSVGPVSEVELKQTFTQGVIRRKTSIMAISPLEVVSMDTAGELSKITSDLSAPDEYLDNETFIEVWDSFALLLYVLYASPLTAVVGAGLFLYPRF